MIEILGEFVNAEPEISWMEGPLTKNDNTQEEVGRKNNFPWDMYWGIYRMWFLLGSLLNSCLIMLIKNDRKNHHGLEVSNFISKYANDCL